MSTQVNTQASFSKASLLRIKEFDTSKNSFLDKYISYRLNGYRKLTRLNTYVDVNSKEEFYDRLQNANFEFVSPYKAFNAKVYRTEDIGVGIRDTLSKSELLYLANVGKIDKSITIHIRQETVFMSVFILEDDLPSIEVLYTPYTYLVFIDAENDFLDMSIGEPIEPNKIGFKPHLSGLTLTLDKVKHIKEINKIEVKSRFKY